MRAIVAALLLSVVLLPACGGKKEEAAEARAVQAEAKAEEREKARVEAVEKAAVDEERARDAEKRLWGAGATALVLIVVSFLAGIAVGSKARKESNKRQDAQD